MRSDDFYVDFEFDRVPNTSWQGRTVYCLFGLLGAQRMRIEGLALLSMGSKGEYRRVGTWTAWYNHGIPLKDDLGFDALIQRCEASDTVHNLDEHEYVDSEIWQELPFVAEDERRHGDEESTCYQRGIAADQKKKQLEEDQRRGMITPKDEQKVSRESGGYRMYRIAIV